MAGTYESIVQRICISDETYQNLLKEFWKPNDTLITTATRIQSIHGASPSTSQPHTEIMEETGIDLQQVKQSIEILIETMDDKADRISELEDSLRASESMIQEYNTRIQNIAKELTVIDTFVNASLSGHTEFLSGLRATFDTELKKRNMYAQIKEHSKLVSHVAMIRPVIKGLVVNSSSGGPICKICLDAPVTYTLNPCGHCYCEHCLARVSEHAKCYQCRRSINGSIKLYI